MPEIIVARSGNHLVATDPVSDEVISKLPHDRLILLSWKMPRSLKQLRFFWLLCKKVADNTDWLTDKEDAREYLLFKARHFRLITNPLTGETHPRVKSIAMESMEGDAFSRLMDRVIHVVITEVIPGLSEADLRREILDMISGDVSRETESESETSGVSAPQPPQPPAEEVADAPDGPGHPPQNDPATLSEPVAEIAGQAHSGSDSAMEGPGENSPTQPLSPGYNQHLRLYAKEMDKAIRLVPDEMDAIEGAFWDTSRPRPKAGTREREIQLEIWRAHRARLNGASSPHACDEIVRRLLG